jgi:hypothetical protein
MANNKVYDYYKDLPAWAKGVVIVGGVAVVVFVGMKIGKAVFPSEKKRKEKELEEDLKDDIKEFEEKGQRQTYPDSSYLAFANTIYDSVRYCAGDDYGNVVDTCRKMMNDVDVAKLQKAYGTRQRYCFGLPQGDKLDLFSTIQAELGQEWAGLTSYRVKQINEDWAKKGIKYRI